MKRFMSARTLMPLLLLLGGMGLLRQALTSDSGGGNIAAAQSSFSLPATLLVVWVGLAALSLLQSLLKPTIPDRMSGAAAVQLISVMAITLATAVATLVLGYLLPVTIGVAVFLVAIGERSAFRLFFGTLLLGPGLWFLFHHILHIRLPSFISADLF